MAIQREWLDWSNPCLPAAVQWLIAQVQMATHTRARNAQPIAAGICDLQHFVCVLPGRRAGRLLLAQLITSCRERGLRLIPPEVLTSGAMTDRVLGLDSSGATASDTEITFAWIKALQETDDESLRTLLPTRPPLTDVTAWRELALTISGLHAELAGQWLNFSKVAELAERMEMFSEGDRWRALEVVHAKYERVLARSGMIDRHQARREAIAKPEVGDVAERFRLVLIGVTELSAQQRSVVEAVADQAVALVHAPESLRDRFDDLGCVIPEQWNGKEIGIEDAQIRVGDRPEDQSQQALRAIAALNGEFAAPQITIGMGDEMLAAAMQRAAEWAGVEMRAAAGRPLRQTAPLQLLQAVAEWLTDRRFANFAAILRHPDIEAWLSADNPKSKIQNPQSPSPVTAEWLTLLDRYFADHLHERLTGSWLGNPERQEKLAAVYDAVARMLAPLTNDSEREKGGAFRLLGEWCQPILDVLHTMYASEIGASHDQIGREAGNICLSLRDWLGQFASLPADLQPRVDAATAIRLLLLHASDATLSEELRSDQIEMLGWLELHLDVAPVLIITGFNDGKIPGTSSINPFLPDSLRAQLGLSHNAKLYARDAYLIEAIRHSREHLAVITGRRGAEGDPLAPSRFLLACDGESLVKRVRLLCGEDGAGAQMKMIGVPQAQPRTQFVVPSLPGELAAPVSMRVTDFRSYLTCPYRFALDRMLKLEGFKDNEQEMDPLAFGSLVHEVLCTFGKEDSIAASVDPDSIEKFLMAELMRQSPRRFGKNPMPAVQVQIARLQQRLSSFAQWQAAQNAEGWRIKHCELEIKEGSALEIPGQDSMGLRGKIDRIDRHEATGDWRIIDYKTSESGHSPHKTHHGREKLADIAEIEWLDLQLPLYHYLLTLPPFNISGNIKLAYICLPKQSDGVSLIAAEWMDEHLESAVEKARDIVKRIRAGEFDPNPAFRSSFDSFARICQTTVFGNRESVEGDE